MRRKCEQMVKTGSCQRVDWSAITNSDIAAWWHGTNVRSYGLSDSNLQCICQNHAFRHLPGEPKGEKPPMSRRLSLSRIDAPDANTCRQLR
jgi:hypothetical protein